MKRIDKRSFLLLEVMIAVTLVTLCILPLIEPMVAVYQAERDFTREVEVDRLVNLLYIDILADLHHRKIPFAKIANESTEKIENQQLAALNFDLFRRLQIIKSKPKKNPKHYLLGVDLVAVKGKNRLNSEEAFDDRKKENVFFYNYTVYLERESKIEESHIEPESINE